MGQHVWLLLATVATELLVIVKWSKGQFPAPAPTIVKWGWALGATLLVTYPVIQVKLIHSVVQPFFFFASWKSTPLITLWFL